MSMLSSKNNYVPVTPTRPDHPFFTKAVRSTTPEFKPRQGYRSAVEMVSEKEQIPLVEAAVWKDDLLDVFDALLAEMNMTNAKVSLVSYHNHGRPAKTKTSGRTSLNILRSIFREQEDLLANDGDAEFIVEDVEDSRLVLVRNRIITARGNIALAAKEVLERKSVPRTPFMEMLGDEDISVEYFTTPELTEEFHALVMQLCADEDEDDPDLAGSC
jgi:hypothetical protein